MSLTFASKAADTFLPPALSSTLGYTRTKTVNGVAEQIVAGNNVTQVSVTNSATKTALPFGTGKAGYLTVQNVSTSANPVFVAFTNTAAAAAVTSTTGWEIPAGQERSWFMDSDIVTHIEHISAGTSTLKLYVSSLVE